MTGADADVLAFTADHVRAADVVFDVVAFPALTPLIRAGRSAGKQLITGAEVITLQAACQFERYTGVALTPEQVARASAFSRQE
jgi:shikimate dehydrogenase